MHFRDLALIEPILRALHKEGYTEPTPIQTQAIPPLLQKRDLLGCAQTGTGKTAAFAIPILQLLHSAPPARTGAIRTLILTPTRELAAQIGKSFSDYGAFLPLRNLVIFGGVPQNPQVQALKSGVDILIATPGRLLDLMNQGLVGLQHIEYFVLDEADRMLDMGFIHDVEKVIARLPERRQTMLFSATMPSEVGRLVQKILHDPVKVEVTPAATTVESILQSLYFVSRGDKTRLLVHLLSDPGVESALVFSRTKHGANKIDKDLRRAGIQSDVIHANKSQNARIQALERFKSKESRVLVATDIVARGIDIDELSHVFNYNLPEVPEAYVHRIGRTGRAGLGGAAVSFCDETELRFYRDIEKTIGKKIPVVHEHPFAPPGGLFPPGAEQQAAASERTPQAKKPRIPGEQSSAHAPASGNRRRRRRPRNSQTPESRNNK